MMTTKIDDDHWIFVSEEEHGKLGNRADSKCALNRRRAYQKKDLTYCQAHNCDESCKYCVTPGPLSEYELTFAAAVRAGKIPENPNDDY